MRREWVMDGSAEEVGMEEEAERNGVSQGNKTEIWRRRHSRVEAWAEDPAAPFVDGEAVCCASLFDDVVCWLSRGIVASTSSLNPSSTIPLLAYRPRTASNCESFMLARYSIGQYSETWATHRIRRLVSSSFSNEKREEAADAAEAEVEGVVVPDVEAEEDGRACSCGTGELSGT